MSVELTDLTVDQLAGYLADAFEGWGLIDPELFRQVCCGQHLDLEGMNAEDQRALTAMVRELEELLTLLQTPNVTAPQEYALQYLAENGAWCDMERYPTKTEATTRLHQMQAGAPTLTLRVEPVVPRG